jgi:hypothetical protein
MSTMRGILRNHIKCPPGHGLLMYVPQLSHFLDLPDIIALHAPSPLMVQYNDEDELFTSNGQHDADQKLTTIYSSLDKSDNYVGKFYPGNHKFDVTMQEEVFTWLEEHLGQKQET